MPVEKLQELRDALNAAWIAANGTGEVHVLAEAIEAAEALVPSDDDEWVLESGYAQNGIAAIAYAARSWISDDPQEAVWAARQVYEAADYATQQSKSPTYGVYSTEVETKFLHSKVVQAAICGIFEDLAAASEDNAEVVRQHACDAAGTFALLFP